MHARTMYVLPRVTLAAALAVAPLTAAVAQEQPGQELPNQRSDRQDQQQQRSRPVTVPVSGTAGEEGDPNASPLTGTFAIQRFAQAGNSIVAVGTLTATRDDASATDAAAVAEPAAGSVRTIVTQISLPLSSQGEPAGSSPAPALSQRGRATPLQTACDVLHLVFAPSEMTLLDLNVQLDPIVLDVVGAPGAANARASGATAVGNLICAISSQLNGTGQQRGQASSVLNLLNQLLDQLG